jgi:hypothetical protein
MVGLLPGYGGSSSSSTGPSGIGGGGSSGAVVQGQIQTRTAAAGAPAVVVVLEKLLGIGIAEAATPVPDGTGVRLVPTGGGTPLETTTTGSAFSFSNVLPGQYALEVIGFPVVTGDTTFLVGAGDLANINGTAIQDEVTLVVQVTAPQTTAENDLQNDAQVGHLINIATPPGLPPIRCLPCGSRGWDGVRSRTPSASAESDRARAPAEPGRDRHVPRLARHARQGKEEGQDLRPLKQRRPVPADRAGAGPSPRLSG